MRWYFSPGPGIHPNGLSFVGRKKRTDWDTHFMWYALQRTQLATVSTEIELRERGADLLLSAHQINDSVRLQERRHVCTMTPISSFPVIFSPSVFIKSRLLPYDWLVFLTDRWFVKWAWSRVVRIANPSIGGGFSVRPTLHGCSTSNTAPCWQ